jgi:hypothetical protein
VVRSLAAVRARMANGLNSEVSLHHPLVVRTVVGGTAEAFE